MGKTIIEILEEQKGRTPSIDIMGNPTTNVFAETPDTYDFPETFLEYLLNLIKRLTHFNK